MPGHFTEITTDLIVAYVESRSTFRQIAENLLFGELKESIQKQQAIHSEAVNTAIERVIQVIDNLLHNYANDLNSSTLREWVVLTKLGVQPNNKKLGFDGTKNGVLYEVKPKNIRYYTPTFDCGGKKLNGDGNFTDFSYERLERYKESIVLSAGFIDGQLMYIFKFPFRCIEEHIKHLLSKQFRGGRRPNQYLRSAKFSFAHYNKCSDLELTYLSPKWVQFKKCFSKNLVKFFQNNSSNPPQESSASNLVSNLAKRR